MEKICSLITFPQMSLIQQQQSQYHRQQIYKIYNNLISIKYNYETIKNIKGDIKKFFQILLVIQRDGSQLMIELFKINSIQKIQKQYLQYYFDVFFQNYILILGNCKDGGKLAQLLLQHKLPHTILSTYIQNFHNQSQKDGMIQQIGGFLKVYYRIFKPQWLNLFIIQQEYFQLLQISFKFINCPQPLTKTTVFNIILSILRNDTVQLFIMNCSKRLDFYKNMAELMTSSIRNEFIQFGQKIQEMTIKDSTKQILYQIDDKITLWQDMSSIFSQKIPIFSHPFQKNVMLPLLIGPLKYAIKPVFSFKYSLLILSRIIKIIKNSNLLQKFIKIIFIENKVYYDENELQQKYINKFKIDNILDKNIIKYKESTKLKYLNDQIKIFYQGIFRSKDNNFILLSTNFINYLYSSLQEQHLMLEEFTLNQNGKIHSGICQRLIKQLLQKHRLITIQSILNCIILINQSKPLKNKNLRNQFIEVYKKIMLQLKNILQQQNSSWNYNIQINQNDLLRVSKVKFGQLSDKNNFQQIFRIVFMWDIKLQESAFFSFYSSISDATTQKFRYIFVKYLLCRKAYYYLINAQNQLDIINDYNQKFTIDPPYILGKKYKINEIPVKYYKCQQIQGKQNISEVWVVDENYLVLGKLMKKQIKIIKQIKYKQITLEINQNQKKKFIIYIKIFNHKSQRFIIKQIISIKEIQVIKIKINDFKSQIVDKQISFINNYIKQSQKHLKSSMFNQTFNGNI